MNNTLENKAKFIAQYWGQKVLRIVPDKYDDESIGNTGLTVNAPFMDLISSKKEEYYLLLKPLSSISDEDAIEVAEIFNAKLITAHVGKSIVREIFGDSELDDINSRVGYKFGNYYEFYLECSDYLRSKGYALPWNDISVEQQIEWGWIKLIEE